MLKRFRRRRVQQEPFPAAWRAFLRANVAAYQRLSAAEQAELERRILVFIDEKYFEGIGIQITDEMRVTIAAGACLLELHREPSYYPECQSIFVYPSAFGSVQTRYLPGGVVEERRTLRLGEAWGRGSVVLAWDAVACAARGLAGGHNVALHEFAHKLDDLDGQMDGVPPLKRQGLSVQATWARVMSRAYRELAAQVHSGHAGVIDPYGASSPAEFFAVVTETFFERPAELRASDPELYALLADFYNHDPAARQAAPPA